MAGSPAGSASKPKKKKKGLLSTIILVIILLVGLGVLLYPTISDYWNSIHQSRAIASYDEAVSNMTETDYSEFFAAAKAYNDQLASLSDPFGLSEEIHDAYEQALDISGTGIMGYVTIEKIGVELPIYHGTEDTVLNIAAGHLEGSSLPIGGEGTHAVISAHRGLPSAKLFTNLDQLDVGDTFTITVLNEVLTYEIDQILIVEPTQIDALRCEPDKDYCTLQTCTPYGINTHRLLVRGHRVETVATGAAVHAEASKIPTYIVAPAVAIPILFVLLVLLLIVYRRKPVNVTPQEVRELTLKDEPEDEPEANEDEEEHSDEEK